MRNKPLTAWLALVTALAWALPLDAQVRSTRRREVVHGEEGKAAAVGPRGVAVKGEDGYAAAGRHGAVARRPSRRIFSASVSPCSSSMARRTMDWWRKMS